MAQGIMTEWEWRKRAAKGFGRHARCWGAQCLQPKPKMMHDRRLLAGMLAASLACAALLPLFAPSQEKEETYQLRNTQRGEKVAGVQARKLSTVDYRMPEGLEAETKSFSREELLRGKLLLLDEEHGIPFGAPAPNTMSVASYGKGMVPVSDLTVRSGMETITALSGLFASLRGEGISCFTVSRGTMTRWEQQEWRLRVFRSYASTMPLEEAAIRTFVETDEPGYGELTQEYTVEVSLSGNGRTEKKLSELPEGRSLLQTAWKYGFVVEQKDNSWRLRYVGKIHAAAMAFLDLDMGEYLELLHERRVLQLRRDEDTMYLIFCRPMQEEYVEFMLPMNASYEASLDNLGYAVIACVVEKQQTPSR